MQFSDGSDTESSHRRPNGTFLEKKPKASRRFLTLVLLLLASIALPWALKPLIASQLHRKEPSIVNAAEGDRAFPNALQNTPGEVGESIEDRDMRSLSEVRSVVPVNVSQQGGEEGTPAVPPVPAGSDQEASDVKQGLDPASASVVTSNDGVLTDQRGSSSSRDSSGREIDSSSSDREIDSSSSDREIDSSSDREMHSSSSDKEIDSRSSDREIDSSSVVSMSVSSSNAHRSSDVFSNSALSSTGGISSRGSSHSKSSSGIGGSGGELPGGNTQEQASPATTNLEDIELDSGNAQPNVTQTKGDQFDMPDDEESPLAEVAADVDDFSVYEEEKVEWLERLRQDTNWRVVSRFQVRALLRRLKGSR